MSKSQPQQPQAPDPYATASAEKQAFLDFYPEIVAIQQQYQPQETATQTARLDDLARAYLARGQTYGQDTARARMDTARAYDPQQTAVRDAYGKMVAEDLALGNQLSDEQQRQVQQATRAGQAARGNIRGAAPTAQETMRTFLAGQGLKNQRMGAAYQYGQSTHPYMSAGGGVGTGAGGSYGGGGGGQGSATGIAQGLTGNMSQMAQQQYGQSMNLYGQQQANYVSPWAATAGGAASGAMTGAMISAAGGPVTMAGGALIGGLGGLVSSF